MKQSLGKKSFVCLFVFFLSVKDCPKERRELCPCKAKRTPASFTVRFRSCAVVTDVFVLRRLWRKPTIAWASCPAPLPTCWPSTWRRAGTWLSGIAVVSPAFQLVSLKIRRALLSLTSVWQQLASLLISDARSHWFVSLAQVRPLSDWVCPP